MMYSKAYVKNLGPQDEGKRLCFNGNWYTIALVNHEHIVEIETVEGETLRILGFHKVTQANNRLTINAND